MRGLYLNASIDKLYDEFESINDYSGLIVTEVHNQRVYLKYDKNEWPNEPVIESEHGEWFCYGWFIFNGNKNDLKGLTKAYDAEGLNCFKQISAGMFTLAYITREEVKVFTDPLGLSTHYIDQRSDNLAIAPSLKCFDNKKPDKAYQSILEKHGSLFGNYTAYHSIYRLEPGACTTLNGTTKYYSPDFESKTPLNEVIEFVKQLSSYWPKEEKSIAISGGMDSRLILACGEYAFGYTYGPEDTGDRPVARQFANDVDKYHEFSYLKPPKLASEEKLCELMFSGASSWAYRLLSAYYYAKQQSPSTHVFFDGYLGDVLQRGAYLKFSGVVGELFKLFPILYRTNIFSAEDILQKRYPSLTKGELSLLLDDYRVRTENLNTSDEFAKLTYYEFVYGRGGRYIINGGNITCGQLFTVIPVFTELNIFHAFLSNNLRDSANYKFIENVWENVPTRFKEVRTETGFKPSWPAFLIPYVHFFNRVKLHLLPGGNYGREHAEAKRKGL